MLHGHTCERAYIKASCGDCRFPPPAQALGSPHIDRDYYRCWIGLKSHFDRNRRDAGRPQSQPEAVAEEGSQPQSKSVAPRPTALQNQSGSGAKRQAPPAASYGQAETAGDRSAGPLSSQAAEAL